MRLLITNCGAARVDWDMSFLSLWYQVVISSAVRVRPACGRQRGVTLHSLTGGKLVRRSAAAEPLPHPALEIGEERIARLPHQLLGGHRKQRPLAARRESAEPGAKGLPRVRRETIERIGDRERNRDVRERVHLRRPGEP